VVLAGGYFIFLRAMATTPENCPDMSVPVSNNRNWWFHRQAFQFLRTVATAPKSCPDMCVPVSNLWKTGVDTCKHGLLSFCVYYLPTDNLVALQYAPLNIVNTP